MKAIKVLEKNLLGRDFIIGDLHGMLILLEESLSKVKFDKKVDRLFSVGDLVDRGKDSYNCLKLIDEPWFYSVLGNHEDLMVEAVINSDSFHNQDTWLWYQNGGSWAESFYDSPAGKWDKDFYSLVERAALLPVSIEIVNESGRALVGICHAQPLDDWETHHDLQGESRWSNHIQNIIWNRDWVLSNGNKVCNNIPLVYCGHTPMTGGCKTIGNVRFIDTGACFKGGSLTIEEINYERRDNFK